MKWLTSIDVPGDRADAGVRLACTIGRLADTPNGIAIATTLDEGHGRRMSDLLAEYLTHREQGHGHHAALKALARRFDLDPATVGRVIDRAERGAQAGGGRPNFRCVASASPEQSLARAEIRTSGGHG